ncbi:ArgS-related anticodon-binding protein NrtL [Streptomyces sp. enrichment culture]|uniref:ArgS-related anticodon-binding protein NrtL n=1 Tax=Streptomyces sp. enrichment culture TaxID=1795815 RepID=UPI003F545536
MTPVELSRTVLHAVRRAVEEGELSVDVPERVRVAPPGPGGCGDYATNVALQLARPAGQPALRVAEVLRARLMGAGGISEVVVTGPGFINFRVGGTAPGELVREILRRGERYGHGESLAGRDGGVVRLRAARDVRAVVHGDVLARLLRSQGASVQVSCVGPLEEGWRGVLEVRFDLPDSDDGRPGTDHPGNSHIDRHSHIDVRPVPAPADPLPLGRDAARWALLWPAPHDRPRIGEEHLVQRESNPLFRVRYAHARCRGLLRNAADLGFGPEPGAVEPRGAQEPQETQKMQETQVLLRALADHPRVLAAAAAHHAPDRLARHLVAVADAVLPLFPAVLPMGEEKPSAAHRARLALAVAAGTVLAGGLSLLGIDAPDHL